MIRLSNCGKSETGGINGMPGDQTKAEYHNINFWDNGWQYVFRYPNQAVADKIAEYAEHAAANDAIGYGQNDRLGMWQQMVVIANTASRDHDPKRIFALCNADCSSSTMAILRAVGLDLKDSKLSTLDVGWTTYVMRDNLQNYGFSKLSFSGKGMLKRGDILMTDGHACIVIEDDNTVSTPAPTITAPVIPVANVTTQVKNGINNLIPKDQTGLGMAMLQGGLIYLGFNVGNFKDKRGNNSGIDGDFGELNSLSNNALRLALATKKITEEQVKTLLSWC